MTTTIKFRTINPIPINPLQLQIHPEYRTLLRTLLESNKTRILWEAQQVYQVGKQHLLLTHSIWVAPLTNGRLSYRVLANTPLGKGGYGTVYAVECIFSFPGRNTIELDAQKMVVKIQWFRANDPAILRRYKYNCEKEYYYSTKTNHLGMEPPIFRYFSIPTTVYQAILFMNRMSGVELSAVLEMIQSRRDISSKLLFMITIELLKAYKEQVLDLGFILHGDVTPKNIMIDLGLSRDNLSHILNPHYSPPQAIIKFIDYSFCLQPGEVIKFARGTKYYAAPEIENITTPTSFNNEKSDIYSLGKCLKWLWLRISNSSSLSNNKLLPEQLKTLYNNIYKTEISSFSKEKLYSIHDAIINMTHDKPKHRWSLEQSIETFHLIANIDNLSAGSAAIPPSETRRSPPQAHSPCPNSTKSHGASRKPVGKTKRGEMKYSQNLTLFKSSEPEEHKAPEKPKVHDTESNGAVRKQAVSTEHRNRKYQQNLTVFKSSEPEEHKEQEECRAPEKLNAHDSVAEQSPINQNETPMAACCVMS